MNISSIGVQPILPQSGIVKQDSPAPSQDNAAADTAAPPDRAAAAPGTGEAVDKLA